MRIHTYYILTFDLHNSKVSYQTSLQRREVERQLLKRT
jgi:hypothetical protein